MRPAVVVSLLAVILLSGCGLNVTSADLFVLTRTGQGQKLTMLVSDGGTIRCDGGRTRALPNALLLQARDIASSLDSDVKAHRTFPPKPGSVFTYRVELQDGTLTFADTSATAKHQELSRAELFAVQAAQSGCGIAA
jgi:hypothetical protein